VSESDFLKSAAQLRKLAAKISDPDAHKRIISVAEEYEAMAALASGEIRLRRPSKTHLKLVPLTPPRGKPLH
jgi:hypothetical protein